MGQQAPVSDLANVELEGILRRRDRSLRHSLVGKGIEERLCQVAFHP
jgi:hypothetical protein